MINLIDFLPVSVSFSSIFNPENLFLISIAVFWMTISSIQDFKRREVENWWNFSLIIFALAFRAFLSVQKWNYWYFAWGIIGLIAGFLIANFFYYTRLFAGGDAKLLMALGTILPLSLSWQINLSLFIMFLLLFLFCGALYGLVYSLFLMFINYQKFKKEFSRQFQKYRRFALISLIFVLGIFILFFKLNFFIGQILIILVFLSPLLFIYARVIEKCCMEKLTPIRDLTIGDWTIKSIKAGKKTIAPNWEGLNEEELKLIKKHCKGEVLVKQGIPFVPTFLIAFIVLILILKYLI